MNIVGVAIGAIAVAVTVTLSILTEPCDTRTVTSVVPPTALFTVTT